jgi:hypothetical protein
MPGDYGSVDRVLQCEADSYSNATAYERSMCAGVGSTCNAPARVRDNTIVFSKCSTVASTNSAQVAAAAAAATAYRLVNCSDSSDDDLTVLTPPLAKDGAEVVTEVLITDNVPLAISTQTNSSSSSSIDNSYDIVSEPAAVNGVSNIISTPLSATSIKPAGVVGTVTAGASKVAAGAHNHTATAVTVATARRERPRSPARTGNTGRVRTVSPSPTRGVSRSVVAA